MSKRILICCILSLFLLSISAYGQEQTPSGRENDVFQARLIKIKRMSEAWENEAVELRLFDGPAYSGRFLSIHDNSFRMQAKRGIKEILIKDVESVILKRKPQDLLLVGLTTVGVAALFGGAASLGFDASQDGVMGAAAVGSVLGFTIGWRAFYQNIVIKLE